MKCLLVSPYFPPALGGACRLMGGIADSLSTDGHQVEVLTFGAASPEQTAFDLGSSSVIHRVPAEWLNMRSTLQMGQRLLALTSTRNFDLIVCGGVYSSAVLTYLVSRVRRVPFIVYSHGEDVTIVGDSWWKKAVLKRTLRSSKYTFANSRFTYSELLRAGAVQSKVGLLYPSIDANKYTGGTDARSAAFLESVGLKEKSKNLLITVARLQERKGHDSVISALPIIASQVPDVHYLIVGKGDPTRLNDLARRLGVESRVTIVSSLSEEALADAYHAASLNVMVSRYDGSKEVEGFGMVYLEAGAAGTPSVAGDQGGAPEAVIHGETGLVVNPTSSEETAHAVIDLLTDDERRQSMGAAAQRRTIELFDDQVFLDRVKEVCAQYARV
jgi:phosphatidyl-myo-inositol dimannoside synthase